MKEIILVGTYHFEQQKIVVADKINEIIELVDYLMNFNPSKIALEWEMTQNEELNREYEQTDDNYPICEIHQIGFRLAQRLQHERVYAINWTGNLTEEDLTDLNKSVKFYPNIESEMFSLLEQTPEIKSDVSILHSFKEINDTSYIKELEKLYLSFVEIEDEKGEKVGFSFLNKWYERELMIFKNLIELLTNHVDERVLLVIGSDHLWLLRKLFEGCGWKVINPFTSIE